MSKTFTATLIRGHVYYLGNIRFENGKAVPVTVQQRNHLEESAVDNFSAGGEDFTKPKFEFDEVVDSEESGANDADTSGKPTRKRSAAK